VRDTKQKRLILSIINNTFTHPTAEEIYNICKECIPNISLGTIYRNLNLMADQGLIRRIKMTNNIDRFDHAKDAHAHFICANCGKIIDLDESYVVKIEKIDKNKVIDYEVNYKGICEECQREDG